MYQNTPRFCRHKANKTAKLILLYFALAVPSTGLAYSANKAWLGLRDNGRYRIHVEYTVIEIKELRHIEIEFSKKEEAEEVYGQLVRGADFYLSKEGQIRFNSVPKGPRPW